MAKENFSIIILNGHGGYKNTNCDYSSYNYLIRFLCKKNNKLYVMSRENQVSHNQLILKIDEKFFIQELLDEWKRKYPDEITYVPLKDLIREEYHLCSADQESDIMFTLSKINGNMNNFHRWTVLRLNDEESRSSNTLYKYYQGGILICEFDRKQVEQEAYTSFSSSSQNYLSDKNPLYLAPTTLFNQRMTNTLEQKCNDSTKLLYRLELISKLKIAFAVSSSAIVVAVFISDNHNTNEKYFRDGEGKKKWAKAIDGLSKNDEVKYHELGINPSASIIWDACRVEIPINSAENTMNRQTILSDECSNASVLNAIDLLGSNKNYESEYNSDHKT